MKGHRSSDFFNSQDQSLAERNALVNVYIRTVNEIAGVTSPKYKFDLLRSRKAKRETTYKRISITYVFYKDGIHPKALSKVLNEEIHNTYLYLLCIGVRFGCAVAIVGYMPGRDTAQSLGFRQGIAFMTLFVCCINEYIVLLQ